MSADTLDANKSEHTSSYYAATQRDKDPFPTLTSTVTADVCIVGGGLTGVAAAVELSEAGFKVALVEANRIGWGASGRNGGQIIGGYAGRLLSDPKKVERTLGEGSVDSLVSMGTECVDIIRSRIQKYQIDCDLEWGFLHVALKNREMRDIAEYYDELKEQNYPHALRMLDATEVRKYLGTDRYIGGMADEGWGHLQVLDLCKGEARAASNLGAEIFEQSPAERIDFGETTTVHTAQGSVKAKTTIFCGNAYLAKISPKLAPRLTPFILPASSYIIATEPLSDAMAKSVMPRNYATCDQRTALDYFRLSADKRMLFGGVSNYNATAPRSITATLRKKMLKVFPQLSDAKIDYYWGGVMGIGINRVPQLGKLAPNVYYAQAYGGHGVAPTHMSARIIAEAVKGQPQRFDMMAKVRHMPFPGVGFLRQSMFAAGMSFHKLRDALP
ncbi:MAG: FAD-binding oxidoreductase [Pseudomonadota bacterium]